MYIYAGQYLRGLFLVNNKESWLTVENPHPSENFAFAILLFMVNCLLSQSKEGFLCRKLLLIIAIFENILNFSKNKAFERVTACDESVIQLL